MRILIVGGPDAGKTSFLNCLKSIYQSDDLENNVEIPQDFTKEEITNLFINRQNITFYISNTVSTLDFFDSVIVMSGENLTIDRYLIDIPEQIPKLILFNKCEKQNVMRNYLNYKRRFPDQLVSYCSALQEINLFHGLHNLIS